ncbi:E3 ubiquitin-protein ligase DTX3L [Scomber scombrus]|uniref:E3 ubiquitin-protein ligase DTX3L n=1 Tax=Scomber scombrus TaxID=13677 RepID=UPI002DD8062E|nr:E3 ubiquitin-protein ligase DTX3L [Scomber scombrus]
MEFFQDMTVSIDGAVCKDPGRLMKILEPYSPEKNGSFYNVRGTYEEMKNLEVTLSALRPFSNSATHEPANQLGEQAPMPVKPVDVSWIAMSYIEQQCAKELSKILGNNFYIEKQPDMKTVKNNPTSTVHLIVRQHHDSTYHVPADCVRQRFITFYQRTVSDLEVTSLSVGSHDHKELQKRFPQLLFEPSHKKYEVTVTGPFVHIARLKEFILQNTLSSRKTQLHRGPAVSPKSCNSGTLPTHSKDPEDESCPICMEPIVTTEKKTLRCKHSFCTQCLKTAFEYKPVCPTCGEIYSPLRGTQPDGGRMDVTQKSSSLPGYERYGTIIIHYTIPSGIQKMEHPNPGQPYEGASRTAYLPDSSEGGRVLKLLRQAFDQRLIFTVGHSTTSGRNNVVTWNDIHHKTGTHGGPTHYGYPDPDYLNRVQDELKAKGIK